MSLGPGSRACARTYFIAALDALGFRFTACALSRDSWRNFHANTMLMRHKLAAASPGPLRPASRAREPSGGPSATPTLVAAESQPSARARLLGSVASAT